MLIFFFLYLIKNLQSNDIFDQKVLSFYSTPTDIENYNWSILSNGVTFLNKIIQYDMFSNFNNDTYKILYDNNLKIYAFINTCEINELQDNTTKTITINLIGNHNDIYLVIWFCCHSCDKTSLNFYVLKNKDVNIELETISQNKTTLTSITENLSMYFIQHVDMCKCGIMIMTSDDVDPCKVIIMKIPHIGYNLVFANYTTNIFFVLIIISIVSGILCCIYQKILKNKHFTTKVDLF